MSKQDEVSLNTSCAVIKIVSCCYVETFSSDVAARQDGFKLLRH